PPLDPRPPVRPPRGPGPPLAPPTITSPALVIGLVIPPETGACQVKTPPTTVKTCVFDPTPNRVGVPLVPPTIRSCAVVIGLVSIPAWAWLPAAAWTAPAPSVRIEAVPATPSLFAVATWV